LQRTEAITTIGESSCEHAWPFNCGEQWEESAAPVVGKSVGKNEIDSRLGGFGLGGSRGFTRLWLARGREFALGPEPIFYLVAGSAATFEKNFVST